MSSVPGILRINVPKSKKTQFFAIFTNINGKYFKDGMLIEDKYCYFNQKDAKDGDKITIELDKAQTPIKVTIDAQQEIKPTIKDKIYPKYTNHNLNFNQSKHVNINQNTGYNKVEYTNNSNIVKEATAPYNFIPYNHALIVPSNYNKDSERYTGTINCRLEALTPLLIANHWQNEINLNESTERKFFNVENKYIIPGSTFKGLFRSIIEILSFSSINNIISSPAFYRNFDHHNYRLYFGINKESSITKKYLVKAGYLKQYGANYQIYPVELKEEWSNNLIKVKVRKIQPSFPGECTNYYFNHISTASSPINLDKSIYLQFEDQLTKEQIKDRNNRLIDERTGKINENKPLPIFYVLKPGTNDIFFIGLPRFFRIPYKFSPFDLLNLQNNQNTTLISNDFTNSLFGTVIAGENCKKGRLSFTHSILNANYNETLPDFLVTLGGPKVTCLSHYINQNKLLIQYNNRNKVRPNSLIDYNDNNARIRGRKYYWHREWNNNMDQLPRGNVKTDSRLFPLPAGVQGEFAINVLDVTLEELGAIFLSLKLWDGCAHKLGLGKSIGLGSVKITIEQINIENLSNNYISLSKRISRNNNNDNDNNLIIKSIDAFKKYIAVYLNEKSYDSIKSIHTLRAMMDYSSKPDNSKTKNMDLKSYGNKYLLPDPLDIYGK
jgi:CRISPR/Cas system CSM-associated protein Csm3 (group 7 of RAMP superfamily)